MMLLAALLVFSFAGCDDDEEKKDAVVIVTPGKTFNVTEDNFVDGDYARFKMNVLQDTTYSITVTSVDADGNTKTDAEFNVAAYASEEDMLDNENYFADEPCVAGVVFIDEVTGNDFYGDDTEAGAGYAYFDILTYDGNKTYTIDVETTSK